MPREGIFARLGIPDDYGTHPRLPRYAEAVELVEVEVNFAGRMQRLTPDTAAAWRNMQQAALAEGIELQLVSGFRSIAYQAELLQQKLAAGQSITHVLQVNAAPGYSQHHTGQAVDITTPGTQPLSEAFARSGAYAWLQEHAQQYRFYMPYGRANKFGFSYEPWHWSQLASEG